MSERKDSLSLWIKALSLDKPTSHFQALCYYEDGLDIVLEKMKRATDFELKLLKAYIKPYQKRAAKMLQVLEEGYKHRQLIKSSIVKKQSQGDNFVHTYERELGPYLDRTSCEVLIVETLMEDKDHFKNLASVIQATMNICKKLNFVRVVIPAAREAKKNCQLQSMLAVKNEFGGYGVTVSFKLTDYKTASHIIFDTGLVMCIDNGPHFLEPVEKILQKDCDKYFGFKSCTTTKIEVFRTEKFKF